MRKKRKLKVKKEPPRYPLGMKPPWSLQRELLNSPDTILPSHNQTLNIIWSIEEVRIRILVFLCYVTAGRIKEVLTLNKNSFGDKFIFKEGSEDKPLKIFLIRMRNEKNRKRKVKDIPLDYSKYDKEIELIKKYLESLEPYERLFKISPSWGYTLIKEATGWNPHFIRHLRCTNCSLEMGWNEQLLKQLAGWTDTRPASIYVETRWTDLI